jgi:hypothetical protein
VLPLSTCRWEITYGEGWLDRGGCSFVLCTLHFESSISCVLGFLIADSGGFALVHCVVLGYIAEVPVPQANHKPGC